MRICPRCKKPKQTREFARNSARTHGRQDYCRSCMTVAVRQSKTKHRETCKITYKRWRDTLAGRASRLCTQAKSRALRFNVPFALTPNWIESKLRQGVCEATGIQ